MNQILTPEMKAEIDAIASRYPSRRAATLPALHIVQREHGHISEEAEQEVADHLGEPVARVHEVVTFYTMFHPTPGGKYRLEVCTNLSCTLAGARDVVNKIQELLNIQMGESTQDGLFTLAQAECLGSCGTAPVVQVNDTYHERVEAENVGSLIDLLTKSPQSNALKPSAVYVDGIDAPKEQRSWERYLTTGWGDPGSHTLARYLERGGYEGLKKALKMSPQEVTDEVKASNLRGLGGAGFPTGIKWGFVPANNTKPVYLAVNADEGEPGTFKDRLFLEREPHRLIEGIAICCHAVGAKKAYIYVRGEFVYPIQQIENALREAREAGFIGKNLLGSGMDLEVYVHRGAGAYICGEETSLLNSLEGGKGWPRLKPPFPAVEGLWGCPTIINNVETLSQLPHILERGAEWFAGLGTARSGGNRVLSVSGRVNRPGLYEVPQGSVTIRQVVEDLCLGVSHSGKLKAVVPGGSSAPILRASECDTLIEFDAMMKAGTMAGSGAIIVLDESVDLVDFALRTAEFYFHESCGQCTPCREGVGWLTRILRRIQSGRVRDHDLELIQEICDNIQGNTVCALGDAAAMPIRAMVQKYAEDFLAKAKA